MGHAQPIADELTLMHCGSCGIHFAVPEFWRAEKQRTGAGWHCPNGCSRVYRESDEAKVKRDLADEKARHAATLARLNESMQAEAAAVFAANKAERETKRLRARAQGGACPCCNRTFKDLARHMATKHPQEA